MKKQATRYSAEVRARAVRMLLEHKGEYPSEWAALSSIASKFDCTTETLRRWVRRSESKAGGSTKPAACVPAVDEQARIRALEREVQELRQANEILRKASAYFAQAELDRRFKP
jgi:transposase